MEHGKMSVMQLTLLTSLSMMGAGILMLPAKLASLGAASTLAWLLTSIGAGAMAYVFARCGMLSKKKGGMGGFAEYAFGRTGSFFVTYAYGVSLVVGNMAIALACVKYGFSAFNYQGTPFTACLCSMALLWVSSALCFRSPGFIGIFTASVIWALLLPLIVFIAIGPFWIDASVYMENWHAEDVSFWGALGSGFPMMFWAFLGLESACANVDAVESPEKNVPKAVVFATLLTAFIYVASTNLVAGIVPNADLVESDAPFGVVYARMLGEGAAPVASALLWLGCAGSLVTWQFTLGRVFKSGAEVGFFPAVFTHVNRANATVKGLTLITLLQMVLTIPTLLFGWSDAGYEVLSEAAVCITLFAYVLCACGSLTLVRLSGASRASRLRLALAVTLSLAAIFFTLCWLDALTLKMGALFFFAGWVFYAMTPAVRRCGAPAPEPRPAAPRPGAAEGDRQ